MRPVGRGNKEDRLEAGDTDRVGEPTEPRAGIAKSSFSTGVWTTICLLLLVCLWIAFDIVVPEVRHRRVKREVATIKPGDDWATAKARLLSMNYRVYSSRYGYYPNSYIKGEEHAISSGVRIPYSRPYLRRAWTVLYKLGCIDLETRRFFLLPSITTDTSGTVISVRPNL